MKHKVLNILLFILISIALSSCFRPIIRKYSFPQVGLYMTITFNEGYGYAILSRDSCVTTLSNDVDYIRMAPFESAFIGLLFNPDNPDSIYYYKGFEEPFINNQSFSFVQIQDNDTLYFSREKVSGGVKVYLPRPKYFEICIGDYMDSVIYKEFGDDYKVAKAL